MLTVTVGSSSSIPSLNRLVFSKGLLVELRRGKLLQLDSIERALIEEFVVESDDVRVPENEVWKPLAKYGGQGVRIGGARDSDNTWVRQRRIAINPVMAMYCRSEQSRPESRILHSVFGVLLYSAGDGYQPGGMFARIGPEPVVNVARGAQVVPILAEDL